MKLLAVWLVWMFGTLVFMAGAAAAALTLYAVATLLADRFGDHYFPTVVFGGLSALIATIATVIHALDASDNDR